MVEQSKLGARKDRYGVFASGDQPTEFDNVVSVQRSKMLEIDGRAASELSGGELTKAEASKVKDVLD